jgi:hypothetical protein
MTESIHPEVDRAVARRIIETVGAYGAPPEWGFQLFTVGIDTYLDVLENDYLADYLAYGGSAFKLVIGAYGGGKTHFLYSVREVAWRQGYTVSYVSLSHEESPFHKLEKVYAAIVRGLMPPLTPDELLQGSERGIDAFLKAWYAELVRDLEERGVRGTELRDAVADAAKRSVEGCESSSFAFAIRHAMEALAADREDDYANVLQWLRVQGHDRTMHRQYSLLHPIDRSQAFTLIRSLARWVRQMGHKGLVILFDEAEQIPSLSSKQRELMLSNLRELIDECGHATLQGVLVLYAVPDENFFEGRSNVYEALKQRIATVFDVVNPTGVRIDLERVQRDPLAQLQAIGERLAGIYEVAFGVELPERAREDVIRQIAQAAYELRFGDIGYKRLFVQGLVRGLHHLRAAPGEPVDAVAIVEGRTT